jgi:ABC-type branched-subunit amino acid transport system ATPase component
MARPKYLLIDEMSLGLAPLIVKRLVTAIAPLVEQFTEVALNIADTVTVMRAGDVRFSGSVEEVRQTPKKAKHYRPSLRTSSLAFNKSVSICSEMPSNR